MKNNKKEVSILRSSAAEYLTFIAATGDDESAVEMRYEDKKYMSDYDIFLLEMEGQKE